MQPIADWLEKLNLGQYAQRFAENDVDVSVLRHLTDADLEKIGVSLGHRRKILAAIAELPDLSLPKNEPTGGVERKPQETADAVGALRWMINARSSSRLARDRRRRQARIRGVPEENAQDQRRARWMIKADVESRKRWMIWLNTPDPANDKMGKVVHLKPKPEQPA